MQKAYSQPFGVEQGAPVSTYDSKPTSVKHFFYITPTKPLDYFDMYSAVATSETGICSVTGIGKAIKNDTYGNYTKSTIDNITRQLQLKYDNSKEFDFLRAGSSWKEPREWSMSLYKEERTFVRYWVLNKKSEKSNNVKTVMLKAKALEPV